MSESIDDLVNRVKTITDKEREQLFTRLLDDPELREDLLDLALVLQAESDGGEAVSLDEYLAGKRTYDRR